MKAFSLMELVIVIIILGILSTIAIPKFINLTSHAKITKLKSDVASIRSSIATKYQQNILEGNLSCPNLEKDDENVLFEGVLDYPIAKNSKEIKWDGDGSEYNVTIDKKVIKFSYEKNKCRFLCTQNCELLQRNIMK